jgi:polyphosphate kinase 2 (PPK2 family)
MLLRWHQWAAARVLQGMDTGGKDGVIKYVMRIPLGFHEVLRIAIFSDGSSHDLGRRTRQKHRGGNA